MRMGAAAFLAGIGAFHRTDCLRHQIVEFQRFDQIGVPDETAVSDGHILKPLVDLGHCLDAFGEQCTITEHSGVALHRLLHFGAHLCGRRTALGMAEMVDAGECQISRILRQWAVRCVRLQIVLEVEAGGTAEHDKVDQRVGAKAVCPMHRNASRFANGIKAGHDNFRILTLFGNDLAVEIARNSAHVIVYGRADRQRLAGQIDTGKNLAAFGDARQTLGQHCWIDMVEMQEDMILVRTNAATFTDFQRH